MMLANGQLPLAPLLRESLVLLAIGSNSMVGICIYQASCSDLLIISINKQLHVQKVSGHAKLHRINIVFVS